MTRHRPLLPSLIVSLVFWAPASSQTPAVPPSAAPLLAVGDTVPPFDGERLDGVSERVDYPKGSATVLLFFLGSCPSCHKMIPEWNLVYARRPKGLRVVGVLLDREPPGFFMATPISFPVVRSPGGDFSKTFKLHKVPLTVRVAAGGKVQDVGVGQLDPIRLGEIFRP